MTRYFVRYEGGDPVSVATSTGASYPEMEEIDQEQYQRVLSEIQSNQ